MTIQQMLNALPIVQKIMELKLPVKKAYQAYTLAKQINEQRDFFINEEKKLIEKFNATVTETGSIQFSNAEDQAAFVEEYGALSRFENEDIKALELSFSDLGVAEFSPMEIAALEGVINFID